jgi:antitoxin (DNA-binding transcriptional repressor) of toxin-antitoxin stability system
MNIDTDDIVSIGKISEGGLSRMVREAEDGRHKVILRSNKPVAAIVDIQTMNRLQNLEAREEELRDFAVALARTATDSGERTSLDKLAANLGVDLDSLSHLDDETDII